MAGQRESWHLSKNVPITMIVAIFLQLAAWIWTVSKMDANIEHNTDRIERVARQVDRVTAAERMQAVQIGKIEESIKGVQKTTDRILSVLQRGTAP